MDVVWSCRKTTNDSEDLGMYSLQEKERSTWSLPDPMWQPIYNLDIDAPTASCDDGTHKRDGHDDEGQHYIICNEEAGDPSVNDTIWQQPSRIGTQAPIT